MRTTLEMILDYMHDSELITEVDYQELYDELQELRYCKEHFYDEEGEENE